MSNRLSKESSPYLRQHGENPVDWYPWCEEAFQRARQEDKPIFLSIGYSTCHWCHVMAHESFEDEEVAQILNAGFISVKVDREERPDVDAVYMQVCTAMTGSGGWPLTVIMTPEQKPFFAATYLPKNNVGNRAGLIPLLQAVSAKWKHDRNALISAGNEITEFLNRPGGGKSSYPTEEDVKRAAKQLADSYDEEYGGFGSAPKFPSAHNLLFLLRYSALSGDKNARRQVENTLRQMYKGGIYDHFGGGFARYSTDREWLAPHFEKTLYDNALLALAYTEAWQDGHMALYRQVAEDTLDYCLRELRHEKGGFFSGQDADSEGVEGAYYLFTPQQVKSVLGEDDGRHFCECYDITEEGNFEGKSIPNLLLNTRWNLLPEGYGEFRERLREYRRERMALGLDDKILTGWNGLMLMALARAAWAFEDKRYLAAAKELAAFLQEEMGSAAQLQAVYCRGQARYPAQLDDYAFYALGLLELYRADFDPARISLAKELAEQILHRFADEKGGGFFRTAEDAETLILRPKEIFDGAMPSGNSAAAVLLSALWRLTAEVKWREAREKQLSFLCANLTRYPAGCAFGLCALMDDVYPSRELVCAAPTEAVPEMLKTVTKKYAPELSVLLKTPANAEALAKAAPFTMEYAPKDGKAAFYLCANGVCQLPLTDI